jgi:SAM-dependent methyltransferase
MGESLKIDIGCGGKKRDGYVGVDFKAGPAVDHVVDLENEPLPFADDSVDAVFSSHFLEHVKRPIRVLKEILRVAKPGAPVEIWIPHARSNIAFLLGHVQYYTETQFEHLFIRYPGIHFEGLPATYRWDRVHFVVREGDYGEGKAIPLPFAIRHLFNVLVEFGLVLTVLKGDEYRVKSGPNFKMPEYPRSTWSTSREDPKPIRAARDFWSMES